MLGYASFLFLKINCHREKKIVLTTPSKVTPVDSIVLLSHRETEQYRDGKAYVDTFYRRSLHNTQYQMGNLVSE